MAIQPKFLHRGTYPRLTTSKMSGINLQESRNICRGQKPTPGACITLSGQDCTRLSKSVSRMAVILMVSVMSRLPYVEILQIFAVPYKTQNNTRRQTQNQTTKKHQKERNHLL